MSGANSHLQPKSQFAIKKGYHHANALPGFDATGSTDQWQKEVYELAAAVAGENNYRSVIDVGCGSAYKLIHYLGGYDVIGIENDYTFQWLKKKYPGRKWMSFEKTDPVLLSADLLICSDVIEHFKNPDDLLRFIGAIQSKKIMISTPERDRQAGKNDYGPPENPYHYREWNAEEFLNYISQWFIIEDQRIFNSRSVTQVIICKK